MTNDWLDKAAKQRHESKDREDTQQKAFLKKRELLDARVPDVWQGLVEVIRSSVRSFNEKQSDHFDLTVRAQQVFVDDEVFVLVVECKYPPNERIDYELRQRFRGQGERTMVSGSFDFVVFEADGQVGIADNLGRRLHYDAIAEIVLTPTFTRHL